MKLISMELENVCQHKHLQWTFQDGLIGIYGPNGSGKSNAINIGCYGGLTNDFSRHPFGKDSCIRQGADKARIRLCLEHQGTRLELTRGLCPNTHRLVVDGGKPIRKASEIQEEIEQILGIRKRLLDDYVFVQQHRMFEFLEMRAADRAKSFAHLCDTTHAEKCWSAVGRRIERDRALLEEAVGDPDEIRQEIGRYREQLRDIQQRLSEQMDLLLQEDEEQEYRETVKRYEWCGQKRKELPRLEKRDQKACRRFSQAVRRYRDANSRFEQAKAEEERLRVCVKESQELLKRYRDWEDRSEREEELELEVSSLQDELDGLEEPEPPEESDPEDLREEERTLLNAIEDAETILNIDAEGMSECPQCGTPVEQLQRTIDRAKKRLPKDRKRLKEVREELKRWAAFDRDYREYSETRAAVQAELRRSQNDLNLVRDELQKLGGFDKAEVKQAEEWEIDYPEAQEKTKQCRDELIEADQDKTARQADRKAAKEAYEEATRQVREWFVRDEDYAEACDQLQRHMTAKEEVAAIRREKKTIGDLLEDRKEALERLQRQQQRRAAAREWLQELEPLRDVMHRDNLPHQVAQRFLAGTEDRINDVLAGFGNPFYIRVVDGLNFYAYFPDGTVMPGPGLSGGQKVVLALAFRRAVNSMFADQIGLMALDEPTDGLDDRNLDCLERTLSQLNRSAKAAGQQILIVTHNEQLARIFDQVIQMETAA